MRLRLIRRLRDVGSLNRRASSSRRDPFASAMMQPKKVVHDQPFRDSRYASPYHDYIDPIYILPVVGGVILVLTFVDKEFNDSRIANSLKGVEESGGKEEGKTREKEKADATKKEAPAPAVKVAPVVAAAPAPAVAGLAPAAPLPPSTPSPKPVDMKLIAVDNDKELLEEAKELLKVIDVKYEGLIDPPAPVVKPVTAVKVEKVVAKAVVPAGKSKEEQEKERKEAEANAPSTKAYNELTAKVQNIRSDASLQSAGHVKSLLEEVINHNLSKEVGSMTRAQLMEKANELANELKDRTSLEVIRLHELLKRQEDVNHSKTLALLEEQSKKYDALMAVEVEKLVNNLQVTHDLELKKIRSTADEEISKQRKRYEKSSKAYVADVINQQSHIINDRYLLHIILRLASLMCI